MSKVLVLKDHTQLEFTDESTILNLVTVVTSFAQVDPYLEKITDDNLSVATFDGNPIENVVTVRIYAESDNSGNVIVHCENRQKSDVELLQEAQSNMEDAIDFLLMNV